MDVFGTSAGEQMASNARENGKVTLMILDLRGNSGGLLNTSIEVARMFLRPQETVVKFVGRGGNITVETGRG